MIGVPEFYANKNVFVTGATGFIGKALVEKLLRSCPDVNGVYCLVRPKRGQTPEERLKKVLEQQLFDRLRAAQPDFDKKVYAVIGDITDTHLGLSETDRKFLHENMHIVFHSAATIRFNEPIRLAVEMNLLGVRRMIQLCKRLTKLEVFVHMSTAYANCERSYIEEVLYPPPVDYHKLIAAIEWMDDDMLKAITPHLIGAKPNTYTFTKQLAESMLVEEASDMPIAIVRPSIVTAAWQEPMPGWIDNINGPSGLYIAVGKGLLRTIKADSRVIADLIPVDFPVNMMLAVGWYTAVGRPRQNALIYHITSGGLNPFTWGEIECVVMDNFRKNPLEACFRRPNCNLTKYKMLHDYWLLVCHMIPAHIADLGYRLIGQKPKMIPIYRKLHNALNALEFFLDREWEWTHSNMDMLKGHMSAEDQKHFRFDPRGMHWPTYITTYCNGTKKYVLKEQASGLPAAHAHIKKLRNIRYTFNTILLIVFWRLMIARSQMARNSWFFMMGLVFKFVQFFRITSTIS